MLIGESANVGILPAKSPRDSRALSHIDIMVLLEFKPCSELRSLIRTYRIAHFVFGGSDALPFKPYPPKPEQCLSFYPFDTEEVHFEKSGRSARGLRMVLMGQHTELTHRFVGRNFLVFQVVFAPGGLFRLTGIPGNHLRNEYIDAASILSPEANYLNEQLAECLGYEMMAGLMDRFLVKEFRLTNRALHPLDITSRLLFSSDSMPSVEEAARSACMSVRQYERVFIERLGVPPGSYLRVVRFERAFRLRNNRPDMDWLTIALHCGYYDYQHLVRDYRAFTGTTPTGFHLLDLSSPERSFGQADTY